MTDMNRPLAVKPEFAAFSRYALEWLSYFALATIWIYRVLLSPVLLLLSGSGCRFEPTCSEYAVEAIKRYHLIDGGIMTVKRLVKCQPWGGWGPDPVPVIDRAKRVKLAIHPVSSR